MKAIILAAGLGTRMKARTERFPKCLIRIHGETIIGNAIRILSKCRIRETRVVVGHEADRIRAEVGLRYGPMAITYVENHSYRRTNTGYSLWLALKDLRIPDSLLLLEGDVFFQDELLEKVVDAPAMNIAVVENWAPDIDGSVVELDRVGNVADWWHISQRPEGFVKENKFKTVNIYKFGRSFLESLLIPALRKRNCASAMSDSLETLMKEIVTRNTSCISALKTNGLKWVEIDDENDLRRAESVFAE